MGKTKLKSRNATRPFWSSWTRSKNWQPVRIVRSPKRNDKYDALMREDNRPHIEIQGMLDEHQLSVPRDEDQESEAAANC